MTWHLLQVLAFLATLKRHLDQQTAARGREYEKLIVVRDGWVEDRRRLARKVRELGGTP